MYKHHQIRKSVQMKISKKTSSTITTPVHCREGDAARRFRCFKFALLVEYNYQHSVCLFTPAFCGQSISSPL